MDAMILVKKIQVEACYPQILDKVVLAATVENPILMDMLTEASGGANPGPNEVNIMRHINQEDVLFMASRLVAKKKLAQEAHLAKTDAQTAANDAAQNAENAAKLAQTADAEQAGLEEEIRNAVEAGQNAIRAAKEAEVANAPTPPGPAVNIPAVVVQIPAMAPIIRAEIPEFDYSFLSICKQGEYHINSQKPKNILLIPNLQDKASVSRSRARADSCTCPGASASARLPSTSKGTEREMLKPTTGVKLNDKALKTSKLITNISQETEEETSTQEDVAVVLASASCAALPPASP